MALSLKNLSLGLATGLFICSHTVLGSTSISQNAISLISEFDATQHVQGLTGKWVENVGDINHDGFADFLVSAPGNQDVPVENAGKVYLVLGRATPPGSLRLADQLQAFIGETSFAQIGDGLAGGGSIDGDVLDDFVIAMFRSNKVALFLGKSLADWTNQTPVSHANTTISSGSDIGFGTSVSIAGDLNGDGIDDLVVGAPAASSNGVNQCGKVFIFFGKSNWPTAINDSQADVIISGTLADENLGFSVKIIPDTNGDGIDELLIGTNGDQETDGSGRAFLFLGRKTGWGTDLSASTASAIFTGEKIQSLWGSTVTSLGDINGDGLGDFGIAEPNGNTTSAGKIAVFLGQRERFPSSNTITAAAAVYSGISAADQVGMHSLTGLGDVTLDGRSDWAAGAFVANSNKGLISIVPGSPTVSGSVDLSSAALNFGGDETGAKAGFSIASVTDFNGDGLNELLIGAPFSAVTSSNSGGAFLMTLPHAAELTQPTAMSVAVSNNRVLIQVTATDPNPSTRNYGVVTVSSPDSLKSLKIPVIETAASSGVFTARFSPVRTRTQSAINQIKALVGTTLTVASVENPAINATLTIQNTVPTVSISSVAQQGLGASTKIDIRYRATDTDADPINWTGPSQVQFKAESASTWQDAPISGATVNASTNEIWVTHNAQFQPLFWNAGNLNGDFRVRLKPADATHTASDFVTSDVFTIDNTAPSAPILATIPSKWAFGITVTGSAEALSRVEIWVNGSLKTSVSANALGVFSATQVELSQTTTNVVSAIAIDAAGNRSVTSNTQTVSFATHTEQLRSGDTTATVLFGVGVAPADSALSFSVVPTSTLITENGSAPTLNHYLTGFDIGFADRSVSGTFVTGSAQVTVTLQTAITPTFSASVYYFDGTGWSTSGISDVMVSGNQLTFSTTHFSRFIVAVLDDPYPPTIGPVTLDSTPVLRNSFFPVHPAVACTIFDSDSHVASWSMTLVNSTGTVVARTSATNLNVSTVNATLNLDADLADGSYQVVVTAADHAQHSATSTSDSFIVSASNFQFSALAGPNPINLKTQELVIGYSLSLPANLTFYFVDLSGRILKRWNFSDSESATQSGYHTLAWNCRDDSGSYLPNGLYYLYLIAKRGEVTRKIKLKVAVLR